MSPNPPDEPLAQDALERHALVSAVWLPVGLVALGVMHHGFAGAGAAWVLAGFGIILAGYVLHVIVNAALGTRFTAKEVALSFALYAAAGLSLILAVLLRPGFAATFFLPAAVGMAALALAVVLYLVTRWGPRQALRQFDIIRDNNPRRSSVLVHRGGRK